MSGEVLHCTEPGSLPARLTSPFSGALMIYAMLDTPDPRMRRTILRPEKVDPPPGALLIARIAPGQATVRGAERVVARVSQLGGVNIDVIRGEARSRVVIGSELSSGCSLSATFPDRRTVAFGLVIEGGEGVGGRLAVGGGSTRSSTAASAQDSIVWMIPSAAQVVRDPFDDAKDGTLEWLRDAGFSPRTFSVLLMGAMILMGAGAVAISSYFAAESARKEVAAVKEEMDATKAAADAALSGEATCLQDRQQLALAAEAVASSRRAAFEIAYGRGPARARAMQRGGARFGNLEVAPYDLDAFEADARVVIAGMRLNTSVPVPRCEGLVTIVGDDVPAYALAAHPDPSLRCPVGWESVINGARLRGGFGISDRMLAELRALAVPTGDLSSLADAKVDERDVDRIGALLVANGIRATRAALLEPGVTTRLPVAPSEVDLWSTALFYAANRMPSSPAGTEPGSIRACIQGVLRATSDAQHSAPPGSPVLPSLAAVIKGDMSVVAVASPSCPWPADAIPAGVAQAVHAVTRRAADKLVLAPEAP